MGPARRPMNRAILGDFPILSLGMFLLALGAGGAWAQKVPQPGSLKKKVFGGAAPPRLVLPKNGEKGTGKAAGPASLLLDQGRVQLYLSILSRLPGKSDRAQRILDLFSAQDPGALRAALGNLFRRGARGSMAPLRGALRLMDELRFTPGLQVLEQALLHRDLGALAKAALRVVLKLDPEGGKDFLFTCLDGKASSLRRAAEEVLRSLLSAGDSRRLAALARARRRDTRLRTLRLLGGRLPAESREILLQALGDSSLICAKEAARGLAQVDPFPKAVSDILAQGPGKGRIFGFALYAALLAEEKEKKDVLTPELGPNLLEGLSGGDPFVSSLSAAALARLSYESQDLSGDVFHDREVMDRLVEVLSAKRFFPEFGTVIGPVERAARLLSGKRGVISGRDWERWWKIVRDGFLARRARLPLADEKNRARAVVIMKDPVETVVFLPKGSGERPGPGEKAVVLSPARQARLVGRLLELGLERRTGLRGGGLVAGGGAGYTTFVLRLEGREMTVAGPSGAPWVEKIADKLRNTIEENLWQLYGPSPGPGRDRWWEEQNRFFASAGKAEKAKRLERLVMEALPRLEGPLRVRALGHLLAIPGLENLLTEKDVDVLFSLVGKETAVSPRTRALLEVVALKKGGKTWSRILSFLARRWDKGGEGCFLGLLAHSAPGRIQAALAWKDPDVRAASARFLGRSRNTVWRDGLRKLLKDPSGTVRAAAVEALANLGDWSSLGDVLRLAVKDPSISVRRSALFFAGRSRDERVFPVLMKALDSPVGSIRTAAIRGLGLSRIPRAADVLAGLLASDPDGTAGRLAAQELSMWGGSHVRAAVRPLLGSPNPAVRESALWVLADSLDGTTIPALLRLLREPAKFRRARRALVLITCKDFPRGAAASYVKWYEIHGGEPETAWFVQALKEGGYEPGFGATDLLPGAGLEAVPGLAAVLKDAREWYLRVQAARRLEEITGKSFGVVTAQTPSAELGAIAQAWLGWLQDQRGKTAR